MTRAHRAAIILAIAGAFCLLLAMLFGNYSLADTPVHVPRTVRETAVALWSFLMPAWFTVEEAWFTPKADDPAAVEAFREGQRKARLTWLVVGGAVGIVIGLTAPKV